ncbi:hypothetical protein SK128_019157, partial [Halocaridina rubra]
IINIDMPVNSLKNNITLLIARIILTNVGSKRKKKRRLKGRGGERGKREEDEIEKQEKEDI